MAPVIGHADIHRTLREQFGLDRFLPGQERIIAALLAGRDALAVLPTGGGKSLVYQLTSQHLDGVTIVVSPLLALMKDQIEAVDEIGVRASLVNSTLTEREAEDELDDVRAGSAHLLYVTPERFDDEEFMDELRRARVALFVVDEAHCVSEWGHSFRPSYLTLRQAHERLGRPPLLALTATATPWIRREIIERLGLRRPDVVVEGADRPNLFYEVRRVETEAADRGALQALLAGDDPESAGYDEALAARLQAAMQGSGIIYTATTRAAEETAEWLQGWGVSADFYHGRRKKADRERVQDGFMDGSIRVIACTNAFGMGVDKPDVRFVAHHAVSESLDTYWQEVGRAGRDRAPAEAILFYRPQDLGVRRFQASGRVDRAALDQVARGLRAAAGAEVDPRAIAEELHLSRTRVATALHRLQEVDIAIVRDDGMATAAAGVEDLDEDALDAAIDHAALAEEQRESFDRSRVEMMRAYAEQDGCRRAFVLGYFGEEYDPPCGNCDWCEAHVGEHEPEPQDGFEVGVRVRHPEWGEGSVSGRERDLITVVFDSVGYRTLDAGLVAERGLLEAV
jgi:ATP-dependent DNA helicase RecQ